MTVLLTTPSLFLEYCEREKTPPLEFEQFEERKKMTQLNSQGLYKAAHFSGYLPGSFT